MANNRSGVIHALRSTVKSGRARQVAPTLETLAIASSPSEIDLRHCICEHGLRARIRSFRFTQEVKLLLLLVDLEEETTPTMVTNQEPLSRSDCEFVAGTRLYKPEEE